MYYEEELFLQSGYACVRCGRLFPGVLDDSREERDCFPAAMPPGLPESYGLICAECAEEAFVEAPENPGGIEYIPSGYPEEQFYELLYEPLPTLDELRPEEEDEDRGENLNLFPLGRA